MALLHSCLIARLRSGEGCETLAEGTSLSGEAPAAAAVVAAYHVLLNSSAESVAARRRYSHCVLIVDNGLRASHEFPDLDAAAEAKAKADAIRAASEEKKRSEARAADLRKQLAAAEAAESKASARLANLTETPVDPAPAAPVAAPPAGESGESGESGAGGKADGPGDPLLPIIARLEAGDADNPVTAADLEALTVPQLRTLAERYDLTVPSGAKKDDLVALLLADD